MLKKLLLTVSTMSVATATAFAAISCGTATAPGSEQSKGAQSVTRGAEQIYKTAAGSSNNFGADVILDKESYNNLYDEMKAHPGTVAIAVIADSKVYTDIVKVTSGETVIEALDTSKFIFKRYMHEQMGAFINSFALRNKPNVFMHGTNTNKNYGDFYPMYYINHTFAQLGVSNFHLAGSEVLEISYDKQ